MGQPANGGYWVSGQVNQLTVDDNGGYHFGYTGMGSDGNLQTISYAQYQAPISYLDKGGISPGFLGPGDFVLAGQVEMPAFISEIFGKILGSILGKGAEDVAETAAKQIVPDVDNLSNKIVRQMVSRGWTKQEIFDTVKAGKAFPAVNKATGGAATEYVSASGKFVVVDNATKQVIQVSGPGFLPNHLAQ